VSRFLSRARARLAALRRDQESGAVLLEFAIVFPAQLFLTLAIMQFTLILVAHVMVQHAAFAAARAALACDVPLREGQQANPQRAAIQAAALILGTIASDDGQNDQMPPEVTSWRNRNGDVTIAQAKGAYGKTTVQLASQRTYVSAIVRHDYVLWIPVANKFFAGLSVLGIQGGNGANAASQQRGVSALRIEKSAFLSRPWLPAGAGGNVGGMHYGDPSEVAPTVPPGGP
jgi:Flp pilus assembly protein TadG